MVRRQHRYEYLLAAATMFCLACLGGCIDDLLAPVPGPQPEAVSDTLRTFTLLVPAGRDPAEYGLVLSNPQDRMAVFDLDLNGGGPYATTDEVVQAVLASVPEYPGEPDHRKVWRFTRDRIYLNSPLTGLRWQHQPALFINSLGFGFCDDASTVNHFLWQRLGYETRIWGLSGHVVSEVKVGDWWEMYDSILDVYYYDEYRNVAGAEELFLRPELVSAPINPILPLSDLCYTTRIADMYGSVDDNVVAEGLMVERPPYRLTFRIPPHGRLAFPLPAERELPVFQDGPSPTWLVNAELVIPAGWTGGIDIALVIQNIAGQADDLVMIGDEAFAVGSAALQEFIDQRATNEGEYFSDLAFAGPIAPVRIRYLVNPAVFGLRGENSVRLAGEGLSGIVCDLRHHDDPGGLP